MSVPPPPSKSRKKLRDLPSAPATAPGNIEDPATASVDLGFKVDRKFHRRYKMAAAVSGAPMKQILEESFEMWLERNDLDM